MERDPLKSPNAERGDARGIKGCRRLALTHFDFGSHSPVGQRHFDATEAAWLMA